jgi:hypothetical protein
MTPDVIEQNKQEFINICREQISRPGLDKLLEYLEDSDFYTAPSSTLFHLNEEGGLCKHSMNVFHTAIQIYENTILPAILSGNSPFKEEISKESIAIATLFHDLCKTKIYHKAEKWRKNESGRWESYIGYELKDEFPFGHGEKSCLMIGWFMRLKLEELLAIRWHMGMFEMTENGTSTKAAYRVAIDKSPLVSLVQCADMISANCLEITTVIK